MLAIKDLVMSKEMDKSALAAVMGGNHGIGNYNRFKYSAWRRTYYRAFRVLVRKGHKLVRGIQYQITYRRTQSWYRGVLRLYS